MPRALTLAAALAAAWLLPLAVHAVGLDVVLPPLVFAAAVLLQRPGRRLLDALVVAAVQVFGAVCVAGLLVTYWPWGLHPVAVSGTGFTVAVLLAAATGRRPRLPRPGGRGDLLAALAAAGVAAAAALPFAARDLGARIGLLAPGEDFIRHYLVFDLIRRAGGYAFLTYSQTAALVPAGEGRGLHNYPQGLHLVAALLDAHRRGAGTYPGPGGGAGADPVAAMSLLVWCYVAVFGFLALAVLWGARRLAGPAARPAALLPLLALVAGYLVVGEPMAVYERGFPNQVLALALAAVLTALVARPLPGTREQLVTLTALVVGLGFTYHLYLPYAAALGAAWLWTYRRRVRRHLAVAAGCAVVLPAALPIAVAVGLDTGRRALLTAGTAVPVNRAFAALLAAAAVGCALAAWRRGAPSRRLPAIAVLAAVALAVGLLAYQYASIGRSAYYFDKSLHLLTVVALVCLGVGLRAAPARLRAGRRRPVAAALATALAAVAAVAVLAVPAGRGGLGSSGLRFVTGVTEGSPTGGAHALLMVRAHPDGGGRLDVDLMGTPYANFFGTGFAAVMQGTYGEAVVWFAFLWPGGPPYTLANMEELVQQSPRPVRFYVSDPTASMLVVDRARPNRPAGGPVGPAYGDPAAPTNLAAARLLAEKYPDRVEVVVVPR